MAPLPNSTFFPTKTKTNANYNDIGVLVNPLNPSPPAIVDRNGKILATWDSNSNTFTPTGSPNDPVTPDGTTIGEILTLNKQTFDQNTSATIQNINDTTIQDAYYTSNTFKPYNTWRDGQNPNATTSTTPVQLNSFSNPSRSAFKDLSYPKNRDPKQDNIKFTIKKYQPVSIDPKNPSKMIRSNVAITGSITLPIQSGISDSNSVHWGEDRLNPIEAAAATTAFSTIEKSPNISEFAKNLGLNLGSALNEFATGKDKENVRQAIIAYFAGQAIGNQNLLTRLNGAVFNPNLEALFQGPQLRNFNFNFQLTPRNKPDVDEVKYIIRTFKQAMAVQKSIGELFLSAPYVFGIEYVYSDTNNPHPYLPLFKDCALTNFSVDYTPDGNYMTYADGSMTSYRLTMQFQELQPIYEDDYGNSQLTPGGNTDTHIGY